MHRKAVNPLALPLSLALLGLLGGCASQKAASPAPAAEAKASSSSSSAPSQTVKSRDGSYEGEVIGKPRPGSKFARLQIGMHMDEVQEKMGQAPDRFHTYESGKRWIPFYFGSDARRLQALYKGEGCLIFTGGNVWGGAGGELMSIQHDSTGACYQP